MDAPRCLSLVQHGTRLYLLNHGALALELFYQLGLRQFGNLSRIRLTPAPALRMLVALAVDTEQGVDASGLSRTVVVDVSRARPLRVLSASRLILGARRLGGVLRSRESLTSSWLAGTCCKSTSA